MANENNDRTEPTHPVEQYERVRVKRILGHQLPKAKNPAVQDSNAYAGLAAPTLPN